MHFILQNQDLNTSHVKVKRNCCGRRYTVQEYLNTSHVKVKQWNYNSPLFPLIYLNTSHVKVKLRQIGLSATDMLFKYISC